jgi:hypothetical protein
MPINFLQATTLGNCILQKGKIWGGKKTNMHSCLYFNYLQLEKGIFFFPHIHNVRLDIIEVFYSPTDTQVNCLENNFNCNFSKLE